MTLKALAQKLRPLIETAAQNFDDTTALEAVELFPAWKTGTVYTTGRRVRHGGILYENNRAVHAIANVERCYDDRLKNNDFA